MASITYFELVLNVGSIHDASVLRKVVTVIKRFGIKEKFNINRLLRAVENSGRLARVIDAGDLTISYGTIFANNISLLFVREISPSAAGEWQAWVEQFMEEPGFVQAWVYDYEFDHWQNAEKLTTFENAGRDHSHLPKISNGLPYPVEMTIIDTSGNPGRRIIREGYVEAIGQKMWLSPIFWKRVGGINKQKLLDAGWTMKQEPNGITLLEADPDLFQETADMERLHAMRHAIYLNSPEFWIKKKGWA